MLLLWQPHLTAECSLVKHKMRSAFCCQVGLPEQKVDVASTQCQKRHAHKYTHRLCSLHGMPAATGHRHCTLMQNSQLSHEGLAEAHDLVLTSALGVEV